LTIQRKRVAKRLASGLLAGALALGGLAIGAGGASANTPSSPTTNRIYGSDRYETAAALARAQLNTTSAGAVSATNPDSLIIASGENFPDALAGGQLATNTRPMLLVRKDSVPTATSDFIADYKSSFATGSKLVFVLGGTEAISADTVTAIQSAITTAGSLTPPVIVRLSGLTRYETAKAIADYTAITQADDSLIIANGASYEDAVTASSLAAMKGWPMILTPSSGLNATVKAKMDSFIALPGGTDNFVLIGAGIPAEIEQYLIGTKSIAPAKIRTIRGADHYQTNFLVNTSYVLTGGYSGANVALVTGENWPDALAFAGFGKKTNAHLVLTPTAGGNANVLTLAVALAAYNDAGYQTNQRLYVVGGRQAVSDAAKTGFAAASATDLTSTITCEQASAATQNRVTISLSGRLNGTAPAIENATMLSLPAISSVMKKNNVALTGSVSAVSDLGPATLSDTRKTYRLTLAAPLRVGDVITFNGLEEGELIGTTGATAFPRTIGSSSCTVTSDITRPTVSITGVAGTGGTDSASGGYFWIHANEPITVGSGLAIQRDSTGRVSKVNFNSANPTLSATVIPMGSATTRGGKSYYTDFVMVLKDISAGAMLSTSAQVPNGAVLNVSASVFADAAGLNPASLVSSTVSTDSASPVLTVGAVKSDATGVATYSVSPLSISAKATGAYFGAKGSGFAVSVVNQRGLLKPTFAVDGTAKTMTITADTGYHTPSDVAQAVLNSGNADWAVNSSTSTLNATIAPASCLASVCGYDTVYVLLASDEPVHGFSTGLTISVGGYGSPFVGTPVFSPADTVGYGQFDVNDSTNMVIDTSKVVVFTTQFEGTGTMSFQKASAALSGVADLRGNYLTAPVTFTVT